MIQGRFSSLTVFFATSPHWPGIVDFLFLAYSRDAKEEITTCKGFKMARKREDSNFEVYIHSILYVFHTLTFRFSVSKSIVNFYRTHYSCKKDPPPTRKLTNSAVFRI